MNNFDRDFNRTKRTVNVMLVVTTVLVVSIIVGSVFLGIFVAKEIKEDGLKGVVEQIWEGENTSE